MNLLSLVPDNLTEVLLKVLRFTELRCSVLYQNLRHAGNAEFQPQDMPVAEFAAVMDTAVAEHLQSHRLIFCDTDNVRFGPNGSMDVRAVADDRAQALLRTDRNAYIQHQKQLWHENALNQAVAQELLEWTCGSRADAVRLHNGLTLAGFDQIEESWEHCENVD
jgi:flagellar basal body rod protein FlgB